MATRSHGGHGLKLLLWGASFSALLWIHSRMFWKSNDGLASVSVQSSLVLADGGSTHHIPVEGGTGQDVESSRTPGELQEKNHLSSSPIPQVVIAMASYPQPHMYWDSAFVWSLRCAGYKGDLVLVVPPEMHTAPPDKLADFFRDMAVTTQAMAKGSACDDQAGWVDPRCLGPEFGRYIEYERALGAYTNEDTRVLLIDFRDTTFQADPFTSSPAAAVELGVVAEMPSRPFSIDQASLTSWWVSECFGEEALQQLDGRPVLCSGSILGSKRAVGRYLQAMLEAMARRGRDKHCRLQGQDQGYHNHLFYSGALGSGEVLLPGKSPVYTVGSFCSSGQNKQPINTTMISSRAHGFVIKNDDGSPAPVVHQIDRCTRPQYDRRVHEDFLLNRCSSVHSSLSKYRVLAPLTGSH